MNDIDKVMSELQSELEEHQKAIELFCQEDELNQRMDNIEATEDRIRILRCAKRILQEKGYS